MRYFLFICAFLSLCPILFLACGSNGDFNISNNSIREPSLAGHPNSVAIVLSDFDENEWNHFLENATTTTAFEADTTQGPQIGPGIGTGIILGSDTGTIVTAGHVMRDIFVNTPQIEDIPLSELHICIFLNHTATGNPNAKPPIRCAAFSVFSKVADAASTSGQQVVSYDGCFDVGVFSWPRIFSKDEFPGLEPIALAKEEAILAEELWLSGSQKNGASAFATSPDDSTATVGRLLSVDALFATPPNLEMHPLDSFSAYLTSFTVHDFPANQPLGFVWLKDASDRQLKGDHNLDKSYQAQLARFSFTLNYALVDSTDFYPYDYPGKSGDSGGPWLREVNDRYELVGVLSAGEMFATWPLVLAKIKETQPLPAQLASLIANEENLITPFIQQGFVRVLEDRKKGSTPLTQMRAAHSRAGISFLERIEQEVQANANSILAHANDKSWLDTNINGMRNRVIGMTTFAGTSADTRSSKKECWQSAKDWITNAATKVEGLVTQN